METNRSVMTMAAAILNADVSADEKQARLDALEGMLRDGASLAYSRMEEWRHEPEACDYYTREWSNLGCAADYVQGLWVAKRPVTPQVN